MKIFLVIILLLVVGCETEVDILTPSFQTTPVIYGVIDPFDSVQSIRIQRSFLIRDKRGALLQYPDSLYYDSVEVFLSGLVKEKELWRVELPRTAVDKESGSFTGENHHVYSHIGKLPVVLGNTSAYNPGNLDIDSVRLIVNVLDINKTFSATSKVAPTIIVLNNEKISKVVSLYGIHLTTFSGIGSPGMGGDMEIRFRVDILEYSENGVYPKKIEWYSTAFDKGKYQMSPERFCNRIMMGLDHADSIQVRTLGDIEVEITIASEEFTDNQFINIWEGMLEQAFSNIPNAIGVFSSKTKGKLSGLRLDKQSLDSLCYGEKWKHLKFVHW